MILEEKWTEDVRIGRAACSVGWAFAVTLIVELVAKLVVVHLSIRRPTEVQNGLHELEVSLQLFENAITGLEVVAAKVITEMLRFPGPIVGKILGRVVFLAVRQQ
jgi:hypothetical protein